MVVDWIGCCYLKFYKSNFSFSNNSVIHPSIHSFVYPCNQFATLTAHPSNHLIYPAISSINHSTYPIIPFINHLIHPSTILSINPTISSINHLIHPTIPSINHLIHSSSHQYNHLIPPLQNILVPVLLAPTTLLALHSR